MVENRNFGRKSKFCSKTEILVENLNFGLKSKFWQKIKILVKIEIWFKIEILKIKIQSESKKKTFQRNRLSIFRLHPMYQLPSLYFREKSGIQLRS